MQELLLLAERSRSLKDAAKMLQPSHSLLLSSGAIGGEKKVTTEKKNKCRKESRQE